jgi:hypothetical protein
MQGMKGFLGGVAKGVVGVVAKPVSGAIGGSSQLLKGAANTPSFFSDDKLVVKPVRPPRFFPPTKQLIVRRLCCVLPIFVVAHRMCCFRGCTALPTAPERSRIRAAQESGQESGQKPCCQSSSSRRGRSGASPQRLAACPYHASPYPRLPIPACLPAF